MHADECGPRTDYACLNSSNNLYILFWILSGVLDTKPTVSELIVRVGRRDSPALPALNII